MSFQQQMGSDIAAVEAEQRRKLNEDAAKRHPRTRNNEGLEPKSQVSMAAKIGQWVRRIRSR